MTSNQCHCLGYIPVLGEVYPEKTNKTNIVIITTNNNSFHWKVQTSERLTRGFELLHRFWFCGEKKNITITTNIQKVNDINVCANVSHCCPRLCVSLIRPRHPDSQSVHHRVHFYANTHPSCSGKHRSCSLTNTHNAHRERGDVLYRVIVSIYVYFLYFCSTSRHCGRHSRQLRHKSGSEIHILCLHIWSHTLLLKHRDEEMSQYWKSVGKYKRCCHSAGSPTLQHTLLYGLFFLKIGP